MIEPLARRRQPFLDIYRGYALLAITLNHFALVAHDEGLTNVHSVSLTPIGLSSAAEIFVLCSGYAFGLAYGRLLDRSGLLATSAKALRRAALLLACNFFMTVASATVIAVCIPLAYRHAGSFEMADYVFGSFGLVLREMISLQWTPAYHDVLPLYALLLAVAPLQLHGLRRAPGITIAISSGVWLLAATGIVGTAGLGLPDWYFNPMAWQFLFFVGMAASTHNTLERLPVGGRAILAYLTVLIAAFGLKLAAHHGMIPTSLSSGHGRGGAVPLADKLTLGPLRIAHALVLAAFMAAIYRRLSVMPQRLLERWLGVLGRSALPVFVASNPLMYLCAGLLAVVPSVWSFCALSVALASSLLLCALASQLRSPRYPMAIPRTSQDHVLGEPPSDIGEPLMS